MLCLFANCKPHPVSQISLIRAERCTRLSIGSLENQRFTFHVTPIIMQSHRWKAEPPPRAHAFLSPRAHLDAPNTREFFCHRVILEFSTCGVLSPEVCRMIKSCPANICRMIAFHKRQHRTICNCVRTSSSRTGIVGSSKP